jgi:hypothetical protein
MTHWHLTVNGTLCPRPRLSDEPTWRRWRPDTVGRTTLALASCEAAILTAPGQNWDGLCTATARPHGWPGHHQGLPIGQVSR